MILGMSISSNIVSGAPHTPHPNPRIRIFICILKEGALFKMQVIRKSQHPCPKEPSKARIESLNFGVFGEFSKSFNAVGNQM